MARSLQFPKKEIPTLIVRKSKIRKPVNTKYCTINYIGDISGYIKNHHNRLDEEVNTHRPTIFQCLFVCLFVCFVDCFFLRSEARARRDAENSVMNNRLYVYNNKKAQNIYLVKRVD